ncbi:General stress protein 69 [uncultured Clostridium sp.]|uniref:aldo/keto reductase n=1 Tax=Enterocloster citroniae TaxID=358743 RepID=UPI00082333C4|nr:aldo/keto reductase [Clostridium sp.]MCD8276859.1 aldo/keto reductase [Enterocloster citroniae]SCH02942.1 General stress protein 69 [uncultured Clostridium sp.]
MEVTDRYVYLGNTGLQVSRIALGCGFRGVFEKKTAVETICRVMDAGINFIDCANVYRLRNGVHAEEALGEALKGKRREFVITSKFGNPFNERCRIPNDCGASRVNIIKCIEGSLRRLQTDYIDIYFLHLPDPYTSYEELLLGIDQLWREGKIRYAGLCNHDAWQIATINEMSKRLGTCPISVIQNPYNLLNRGAERELWPMAEYHKLGTMAYSPLAAGLLGGDFTQGKRPPEKSTWSYDICYAEYLKYVFHGRIEEIVNTVNQMAVKYHTASAAIAAFWVLKNKHVTNMIAGTDSEEEFVDFLKVYDLKMDKEDILILDEISQGMEESFIHFEVEKKVKQMKAFYEK